ncbi:MAG: manganese efflux pump MntP family protein [candidate division Zixibacteria bacterium]|jgi:putative Mn2+ efflux pump MntP|nr:manganese efflux pump MntP family protein [candidate division Zixibacteria bacterium]
MNWVVVFAVALGLAMDAFAVAIAVGSRFERLTIRPLFRLSFHFGLFQFLMPILGWYLGARIERFVDSFAPWLAFGLLAYIGIRMIRESRMSPDHHIPLRDPTRKWSLVMLSVATSIDALAVGFSIAMLRIEVWSAAVVIGVVACLMTAVGMTFGRALGERFGRAMEFLGGCILIGIGLKALIQGL